MARSISLKTKKALDKIKTANLFQTKPPAPPALHATGASDNTPRDANNSEKKKRGSLLEKVKAIKKSIKEKNTPQPKPAMAPPVP